MLNWSKRTREWRRVMAMKGVKVSPWNLVRAVLSGPVPADVWRDRIRICLRCPVYDSVIKACRKVTPVGAVLGCGCYSPFKALTAAPYPQGCWAKVMGVEEEGWPSYRFISLLHKWKAVWKFMFP